MKVVQFLPALKPGVTATVALEFANELNRRGHESLVISAGGPLEARLRLHGSEHIEFPMARESVWSLRHVPRLRGLLKDLQPDIVHTHGRLPAFLAWRALRREPATHRPKLVPLVDQYFSRSYFNKGLAQGDGVIATSCGVAKQLKESLSSYHEKSIDIIYRGVNIREFDSEKPVASQWQLKLLNSYPQLEGKSWWLLPGEISSSGGQEAFLHMLAKAAEHRDDIHGVIVGEVAVNNLRYLQKLESMAQTLNLGGRVTFLGKRGDMRELYATSQLVFHLSGELDASGKFAREALVMGRPVIAYPDGCAGEILQQCFPEGLVGRGDINALVESSLSLMDKPGTASFFDLSYSAAAAKAIDFFQKILDNKRPD
ncbi:glycosyltransferase [Microbulbifer sp. OS29]|uniref:Glycosyltransferase n=1 Tax=Microbulbifer okhotskensis TaxID=2926617 RepID=A0A9X2ELZ2_9GAMM|nr:glycosyltransferase [Microbulbifer okhotskensis]MCO1334089.1 glycosyltransferase [Microbulbifer okhotskensis]